MDNTDKDWIKDNVGDISTDSGDFEGEVFWSTDGKHTVHVKASTKDGRRSALAWGNEVYKRIKDTYGTKQAQSVKEYAKEPIEDLGKCSSCGAPNKKSLKSGKLYCSALCWKN
jgi:ribosomal protein L44E